MPLLCIFGIYRLRPPTLKLACLILVLGWMVVYVVVAIWTSDWNVLMFPAIVGIGWTILHPMLKHD